MKIRTVCLTMIFLACLAGETLAHFGMIIPSKNILTPKKKSVKLDLSFSHPFEIIGMELAKPKEFFMFTGGQKTNLLPALKPAKIMKHAGWTTEIPIKRPGVYSFVMEPTPYWEPAEDLHIIHYTKTVIAAFGDDQGWDEPVGIAT
ncbi:MAG: DUF4198 domain-containing protein, partial [Candidatus Electrothrix sp. AR4]|nr:DUF4198 domain-containing protein [Candidatus Electrothrix sp. AR4]